MTFEELLDQALALLQWRGRVTYLIPNRIKSRRVVSAWPALTPLSSRRRSSSSGAHRGLFKQRRSSPQPGSSPPRGSPSSAGGRGAEAPRAVEKAV